VDTASCSRDQCYRTGDLLVAFVGSPFSLSEPGVGPLSTRRRQSAPDPLRRLPTTRIVQSNPVGACVMKTLMLSFGISGSTDRHGRYDDGTDRYNAATGAAFELGPAWMGGQRAIFLRTAKSVDEVHQHLLRVLDDRDLLLVVELPSCPNVTFAGVRHDTDGFDDLFPTAAEVPHLNSWAG
jgi:hypothetical protein